MDLNILIHIIIFVIAIAVAIIFIVVWYVDHRKGIPLGEEGTLLFGIVLFICWGVISYCSAGFLVIFLNLHYLWEGILLLIVFFGGFFVFFIYAYLSNKIRQMKSRPGKPRKEECPKCGSLLTSGTCRKCGYEWTERKKDKLGKDEELTELKLQLGRGDITFVEYDRKKKKLIERS